MLCQKSFTLGLTKAMLDGAKLAIVPGAPERVERIARLMDRPKFLASTREFTSWLGYIEEHAVATYVPPVLVAHPFPSQ